MLKFDVKAKQLSTFDKKKLKERFSNTYKFSNNDSNKFILFLGKSVYPYEYMDAWEKFNKASLPEEEDLYSDLNMNDITDGDYVRKESL